MNRVVDYFVVVGFDHEKLRGGTSSGKIIQRFPEKDWSDTPFIDGLELFCQPLGWRLSCHHQQPTFFVSVLTDIDANRHYCACLSFNEPISVQPIKQPDDEDLYMDNILIEPDATAGSDINSSNQHHSIMYAPKCLVLVSRHYQIEAFKNCLGTIYTVYIDGLNVSIESIIGNLLGCIEMPPPGGPQIKFSLGAGDRHALHSPLSPTVPCTGTTVYQLFDQLGIHSVMELFSAVMTEHKLLFKSKSYSRLHDACHALTCLMYPFVYSHVYIPVLPSALLDFLDSPTPFIMGVHSSLHSEVADLLDVIIVDLDKGCISVPDCIHIPKLSEPFASELVSKLCLVIRPQLSQADDAFPSSQLKPSHPHLLDKEIRAIFVRLFAQLLQGYRSCLQIVRIHPKPFITFHKAFFLGHRNLVESEFVVRLLDSMFFNIFIRERGPPFRVCDMFDELYATVNEVVKREIRTPNLILQNIKDLAQQLYLNENPMQTTFAPKIPQPTEGCFTRIHQPIFPQIAAEKIDEIIENERIKLEMTMRKPSYPKGPKPRIVPIGPPLSQSYIGDSSLVTNSARRLEVMRNCINCIFENKISDARKTFPAVLRALKNKFARLALAQELSFHVSGNKAVLEHEQFDLIVRLMNCTLQQDSEYLGRSASFVSGHGDVNGVAAAILPLAMAFCRRLCTGVIQFAYTCIQDHKIWDNHGYWESTFYRDVEKDIKSLYLANKSRRQKSESNPDENRSLFDITSLDVCADQLRILKQLTPDELNTLSNNEESTVFSQAIHYTTRIAAFKIPIDIGNQETKPSKVTNNNVGIDGGHSDSNSNVTGTGGANGGRESFKGENEKSGRDPDNESGFEEDRSGSNGKTGGFNTSEIGANAIKFVGRFVDNVCTEGGVSEDHIKALHSMIPGVVAMQIETLEAVYKESRRLPPITKPKIMSPNLLPGEEMTLHGLRVYLLPDGRDETVGSSLTGSVGSNSAQSISGGGPVLLPSEGAIFITNYRIIFKGKPCDPFSSESIIVRSFPIATLTKEKRISLSSSYILATIDQYIQEGVQLRSNQFQLMRIAFDEEVSSDAVEVFRKQINKQRSPPDIFHLFTFTQSAATFQMNLLNFQKHKEKHATIKGFAKKTLLKTAAKAGLNVKTKNRKHKYFPQGLQGIGPGSSKTFGPHLSRSQLSPPSDTDDKSIADDISVSSDSFHHSTSTLPAITVLPSSGGSTVSSQSKGPVLMLPPLNSKPNDTRTLHKLCECGYVKDYCRLGLGTSKDILTGLNVSNNTSKLNLKSSNQNAREGFRISLVNWQYSLSRSYPAFISVPNTITDESLRKISRCYRHSRLPAIIWKHPKTKGLLLRASSLYGKGVIGMLKGHGSGSSGANQGTAPASVNHNISSTETSAALEQEKFFKTLISLTPSHFLRQNNRGSFPMENPNSSNLSIPSLVLSGSVHNHITSSGEFVNPPDSPRKASVANSFQRAVNTLRSSGGKGPMGSIGLSMGKQLQKLTLNKAEQLRNIERGSSMSSITSYGGSSINSGSASFAVASKVSLYVFGEKSQIKNIKSEQFPNSDFISADLHEVRHIKQSFKKLMKACCPSSPSTTDPDQSFYRLLENSEWLKQLQSILTLSGAMVDLIDLHGASVMLCLEDGWDLVPQIVSVVEICLDPYYRTFEGFRILIEKEWLAFGHRFTHRLNHTAETLTSGFAPLFLQFLDIVHQIMTQFPLSFEFNQYYLKFIAYHHVSCRFRTFLLDNECERSEVGWLAEDIKRKIDFDEELNYGLEDSEMNGSGLTNGTSTINNMNQFNILGTSFWEYAEKLWKQSSVFYNFYYIPTNYQESDFRTVLRPYCSLPNLKIWDYYLGEELSHGPSYDFEVVTMEKQRQEELEATNQSSKTTRKIMSPFYDSISHMQPDSISVLLDTVKMLETELGLTTQKWNTIWDKIEIPFLSTTNLGNTSNYLESLARQGSIKSQIMRRYCTSANKKNSIDSVMKGKILGTSNYFDPTSNHLVYSHRAHCFEKYNYKSPTACDHCKHILWDLVKSGMKCADCGFNSHEKCLEFVPKDCSGSKSLRKLSVIDQEINVQEKNQGSETKRSNGEKSDSNGNEARNGQTNQYRYENDRPNVTLHHSNTIYDHFNSTPLAENRTHEGYLLKKGALLKGWKQRWFVLDSIKHQLRYYDSNEDTHCKGFIDLAEVVSVSPSNSNSGSPFFDLKTIRRTYNFMASDGSSAHEWIEKLQACLQ